MNQKFVFQLTQQDSTDFATWVIDRELESNGDTRNLINKSIAQGIIFGVFASLAIGLYFGIVAGTVVFFMLALLATLYKLQLPAMIRRNATSQAILHFEETQKSYGTSSKVVSIEARGVMEVDDCEERLTLWDAISEVHLTDKFLCAKDKRGGVLLIPMRAFGSEAAANLFKIEMDNHRMRHAVGLAPATPVVTQPTTQVTMPTVPQEAPQQQATAGWWRKPQ